MIEMIITALLPILITLLLGLFAGWHQDFSQDQASVLNKMVMLYALPLALFIGIVTTPLDKLFEDRAAFFWISFAMVAGFIIIFLFSKFICRSNSKLAALRGLVIAGPAVPFVGIPVLGVLFPTESSIAVAVSSIVMNIVQVPLALIFLVHNENTTSTQRWYNIVLTNVYKAIKQPVVWAPVCAFILLLCGVEVPKLLKGSFTLLGGATGGVALFAVGAVLYAQKIKISLPVIVNVICKNLLLPGVFLLLMYFFGTSSMQRSLVSVTLAIPSASIAVIFAVQYAEGEREIATTLFFSTILAIFTMGIFIWLTESVLV